MKKIIILVLINFLIGITQPVSAQVVNDLNDVAVWTFNFGIWTQGEAIEATYVNPQYCIRGWMKTAAVPYNAYTDPQYNLWTIPPIMNDNGTLLEGGVQVSEIWPYAGWPWDSPYDDDHQFPYEIPDPVFYDLSTRNTEDSIYWQQMASDSLITFVNIANENFQDYLICASYQQIDAGVNALDYDGISGAERFSPYAVPGNNANTGYDDYHLGTANFTNKLSMVCNSDTILYFMPIPNADSEMDSAKYAFDDDLSTYWISETGSSHWIEIDFGRIRTVQQVYIFLDTNYILNDFSIKYQNDTTTDWVDFTPAIDITNNTDPTKSFLVEPVATSKIRLFSTDTQVYLPELQIFGQGFRQFLLKKYCIDSAWTATDSRWETDKLISFADTNQCPDETMNSFNYRNYLQYHNWTYNPFGGNITQSNFLNPPNPLFFDWLPVVYLYRLFPHFMNDSTMLDNFRNLFSNSYSHQTISLFWNLIHDNVTNYAANQGKTIHLTYGLAGTNLINGDCDYILYYVWDNVIFPVYSAPTASDTLKTHLNGSQAQINSWRLIHEVCTSGHQNDTLPVVAFLDHGFGYMPFSHLGGNDEPADERTEFLRTYTWEIYAAGVNFCFPVKYPGWRALNDTASDGTPVIETIKLCADFLNVHKHIYRNVIINNFEQEVTVNGVIPFNGEWNLVGGSIISPVNDSKVTISYMDKDDGTKSYLHIINHNWDSINHQMIPQYNVPVSIPVTDSCENLMLVSPDFADTLYPAFSYNADTINFTMDTLKYCNVIILEFTTTTSINENQILPEINISIYPNPTTGMFIIEGAGIKNIEITNISGQVVYDRNLQGLKNLEGLIQVDLSKQPKGIYFIKIMSNNIISVKKIIIQ